ncbi:MAG: 50S ribosomal protein L10 [Spirochaetaceae bacterium]|nr:50S ribosomal protein L10 [Spirochaetaceae bacterium]MCF7947925.1 50S ribosomal protein L10 [Spirochaetia bacterium]MCF7950671.1 50S ribosomal protein L10 [Spirochaetaceae bacterium]
MAEYVTRVNKEKTDAVNQLKEMFQESADYIFTNYRGLSVSQISELRNKLREEDTALRVVKNRYAKIALKELERPEVDDLLIGPTAVALPRKEAGPAAKILVEFGKENPVEIKGGIIGGDVFDVLQMEAFSKLPTRDELIAKLMGTMNAPIQNFVYTLNAVPQKLVRVLQAVADKKQEEG